MKHLFATILILSPILLSAQETATSSTSTEQGATASSAMVVANVSLVNASLAKISTSTYLVSFALIAQGERQTGVRYLLSLANEDGAPVAVYTFDKELSLEKGSSTPVREEIVIPKGLSGTFSVLARALTANGLPLGSAIAGTLEANDVELVRITSCNADRESYAASETLKIECTVREVKKGALADAANGGYVVKAKAFYTNRPREEGSAVTEIVGGKATLELKGLTMPGLYTIYVSLAERGGVPVGKEIDIPFSVNGVKVSILNMLLDKDMYVPGESARATISADVLINGQAPLLTLTTDLTGKDGACASSASREPANGVILMELPITAKCINPTLSVRVTDPASTVFATSTISLTSAVKEEIIATPEPSTNPAEKMVYGGVGGLGLLVGLLSVFIARRRVVNIPPIH